MENRLLKLVNQELGYKLKAKLPIGSVVLVEYEIAGSLRSRKFTGICIHKSLKGVNVRYTLRNVINGYPVEFSFYHNWNYIIRLEVLSIRKFSKVKRSNLVYLRNKKLNLSKV